MSKVSEQNTAIWLYLLKEGRCTTVDVERATGIDRIDVDWRCRSLHDSGMVKKFPKERGNRASRVMYGVTGECKVPKGAKVNEIIEVKEIIE